MIQIKKNAIQYSGLHIFLLPIFFVLHNYVRYSGLVSAATAYSILGELLVVFLLIFLLFFLFTRNISRSLLLATVSGIFLLFYGVIKDFLKITLGFPFAARYVILLPVLLLATAYLCLLILKKKEFKKINFFLNTLLAIFIIIDGISLLFSSNSFSTNNLLVKQNILNIHSLPAAAEKPDVYYLLFDCYPGTAYLREYMQYDNASLDTALMNTGFYVVKNPRSNYHETALSLSSILNFEYLEGIVPNVPIDPKQYNQAQLTINLAIVPEVFAQYGYKIYNLSIFEIGGKPPLFKENFLALPERQILLYNTVTERVRHDILWNFTVGRFNTFFLRKVFGQQNDAIVESAVARRSFNNTVIDSVMKMPLQERNGPKFIYAHFYLPHPPFFYDKDGKSNNIDSIVTPGQMRNKTLFLSYVEYTNKVMLAMINRILQESVNKPVIIVQGDHGFRDVMISPFGYFKNYSAFYFPDKDYSRLYDTLSNINTFPLIFNKYFNTRIPLQKDSTIF